MALANEENEPSADNADRPTKERVSIKDVLQSVGAAALGVQSSKNRERDFKGGSAGTYIVAGIVFTALFIGGVFTVVQLVLANAGG